MEVKVKAFKEPIRLDRYLKRLDSNLTQGIIEKSLRKGRIRVNNVKVAANYRVVEGDLIYIIDGMVSLQEDESNNYIPTIQVKEFAQKLLTENLLFENESFYAFFKPPSIPTQGGSKISMSLDDAFRSLGARIVHRLDKDTSGIILAAKTRDDAVILTRAFEERKIQKHYFAIVSPSLKRKSGKVENFIFKKDKYTVGVTSDSDRGAKHAITEFIKLKDSKNSSLVEFLPLTGRMHQIRVHAHYMGSPIIGDVKYEGVKNDYLLLHAGKIVIDESVYGQEIVIKSDLPEYFNLRI